MKPEERQHLEDMLHMHQRRLRILELQAATEGSHVRPEIQIEIEDLQVKVVHIQAQLVRNRPFSQKLIKWVSGLVEEVVTNPELATKINQKILTFLYQDLAQEYMRQETRSQEQLPQPYDSIRELRKNDEWQESLNQLDELERTMPANPEIQSIREWAEGRKRREQYYEAALVAYEQADWNHAVSQLEALLIEFPSDDEAMSLLKETQIERQLVEEQKLKRRTQAEERRKRHEEGVSKLGRSSTSGDSSVERRPNHDTDDLQR